ncbi:MAG: glucose-6-phosphate isomerase [Christensenellaceae bacterium]|jgi:glucose-6-phosphate isomerase
MQKITFDFNHMLRSDLIENGLLGSEIQMAAKRVGAVHAGMEANKEKNVWRTLPYAQEDSLEEMRALGKSIRQAYDNFVVLGIGGSALGSKALFTALSHLRHNELPKEKRNAPKFYVLDNVDPEGLQAFLEVTQGEKTCFHVITKSGNTVETLSQFIWVTEHLLKTQGQIEAQDIIVTTDAQTGILKEIATAEGYQTFIVPEGVGGRFSVLSPVGLLSAIVLGMDVTALLAGAGAMEKICSADSLEKNPAYMYALLLTLSMEKGKNIQVMLPYADSLVHMADWYAQLWAESLGKKYDIEGNVVHTGQTPVRALGVTDQHSQIQLYTEGPFDKVITFLTVGKYRNTLEIPKTAVDVKEAAYLQGNTFNALIQNECLATEYAVTKAGKMNMRITLSEVNAYTIGALLLFFEMATAAAGLFLEIDAFDQPGVEEGKIATFALMDRAGYETKKADLQKEEAKEVGFFYIFQ